MRWLIERQLRKTAARLRSAREELENLGYEVASFSSDTDDLRTLAVVADRVDADNDFDVASHQLNVLVRAKRDLQARISGLEQKQDLLLDRLSAGK